MKNKKLEWEAIRKMLKTMKATEIATCGLFNVTAKQIYAMQKKWKKEEYNKSSKYQDPKYQAWRKAVLHRDKERCIICLRGRDKVKVLHVDHIKAWSMFPHLRFVVSNGRTLCTYHHKRTLNYGFKALTCNDALNGKAWEFKEKLLWKKKESERLNKSKRTKTK
jgi:hypothetical protein